MTIRTLHPVEALPESVGGLLVRVADREVGVADAHLLAEALLDSAAAHGGPILYVDFEAVESVSSAVLGPLILVDRKLQDAGGRLVLVNVAPLPYEVFQVARLTDLLDIRGASGATAHH